MLTTHKHNANHLSSTTGAIEALAQETHPLGLRTLLIEPGRFRTELLSQRNLKLKPSSSSHHNAATTTEDNNINPKIPESYATFHSTMGPAIAAESGNQPGDPTRLVEIVIDLVKGEGVAVEREVPLRVVLGKDAYEEVGGTLRGVLESMQAWEGVGRSTDFQGES